MRKNDNYSFQLLVKFVFLLSLNNDIELITLIFTQIFATNCKQTKTVESVDGHHHLDFDVNDDDCKKRA